MSWTEFFALPMLDHGGLIESHVLNELGANVDEPTTQTTNAETMLMGQTAETGEPQSKRARVGEKEAAAATTKQQKKGLTTQTAEEDFVVPAGIQQVFRRSNCFVA